MNTILTYPVELHRKTLNHFLEQVDEHVFHCKPALQERLYKALEETTGECSPLKFARSFRKYVPRPVITRIQRSIFWHGSPGFIVLTDMPEKCCQDNNFTTGLTSLCSLPIAYPGEGDITISIKPQKGAAENPSFANSKEFYLHTDLSYVPVMPDVLVMVCKNPAADGGGESLFSCVADIQHMLPHEIYHMLRQPQFRFDTPDHYIKSKGEENQLRPVITYSEHGLRVRYRYDKIHADSVSAVEAVKMFNAAAEVKATKLLLPKNSGVIVNQRYTLHGRSAFQPTFDDNDRELTRAYGTLSSNKFKYVDYETGAITF